VSERAPSGATLRLRHVRKLDGEHRVHAVLSIGGDVVAESKSRFGFELTSEDRRRMRWYWEDHGENPPASEPMVAQTAVDGIRMAGSELFRCVFGSDDGQRLWSRAARHLDDLRIEVAASAAAVPTIPWELLRSPAPEKRLATRVQALVRSTLGRPSNRPAPSRDGLRVLLVAAPPSGQHPAPFRSVAAHLLRSSSLSGEGLRVDVLRPPTYERLAHVLAEATDEGRSYDVVHFDGHGVMVSGEMGRLVFPRRGADDQLVGGRQLARLLIGKGVRTLVLNASHVLHGAAPSTPEAATEGVEPRPRAFLSLAGEAMEDGVPSVVVLPYGVPGARASTFCSTLYDELIAGRSVGDAVTRARRVFGEDQELTVPAVAFEPSPLRLVSGSRMRLPTSLERLPEVERRVAFGADVPIAPASGFIGRDELVLQIDRAFDDHHVVLLHGGAGSGKSTTAVEFATWYARSGGLRLRDGTEGVVLFTSFEREVTPDNLFDQVGEAFEGVLKANDITWLALPEGHRRSVAVQLLEQVPMLWVFDHAESYSGDQQALAATLALLSRTGTKVLVTSRRDDHEWLGDTAERIPIPPMPWRDGVQLASALWARRAPDENPAPEQLEPLIAYASGQPLVLRVLVRQAVRHRVTDRAEAESFIARVRECEHGSADARPARALDAAIAFGLRRLDGRAGKILALLHLFQKHVDVDVLRAVGDAGAIDPAGLETREEALTLLDQIADAGVLEPLGEGRYTIHPAFPPTLERRFEESYGPADGELAARLTGAWSEAVAGLSSWWYERYRDRRVTDLSALAADEFNLLRARRLSLEREDWGVTIPCMNGLWLLYGHAGRTLEWAPLVEELVAALADPSTNSPRAGLEDEWRTAAFYRVRLARSLSQWELAERLLRDLVGWLRERADGMIGQGPNDLDETARGAIYDLAVTVQALGHLQREQARPDCVPAYEEAIELFRRIGAQREEAEAAFSIARAYGSIDGVRDLAGAERWFRRTLELLPADDRLARARAYGELGSVAFARYTEADAGGEEGEGRVEEALDAYRQALEYTPPEAIGDLAMFHAQLGNLYSELGQVARGLEHHQMALRSYEASGDVLGAGRVRYNVAVAAGTAGQLETAVLFLRDALRDLEVAGPAASEDVEHARRLLETLDSTLGSRTS
jgi:tetratricopeptide (TPR) repeat protein